MANTSSVTTVKISPEVAQLLPITIDGTYKGDEIQNKVAQILGLTDTTGWTITDQDGNLVIVHYTDEGASRNGHLRGVVVDIENEVIVATSFGHTPTVVTSQLEEKDGLLSLTDNEGIVHVFDTEQTIIKRVFEGVVIRVIWYNNKCYRLTHRKINADRSRWGSSPTFLSMYEVAGGPKPEELFDTSKPYSSSCYVFLVSHPSLLVGTRQHVTKPFIVNLAQFNMDLKRPADEVAPGLANFVTDSEIGGSVNESFIHEPLPLTLEEANNHIKYGYYNDFKVRDERQLTGEAVIIYQMVDGKVTDIVKVHSPAYDWRLNMRGNSPNIEHRFYSLLDTVYKDVKTEAQWEEFKKKLIPLSLYDESSIKELFEVNQGIITIPDSEELLNFTSFCNRDDRIYLLWINYVLSLPTSVQFSALKIYSDFINDRNHLIEFIQSLERNPEHQNIDTINFSNLKIDDKPFKVNEKALKRLKIIIVTSRQLARKRIADKQNYSASGKLMNLPMVIKSTIRNLICKEKGTSLYQLTKLMKDVRKATPEGGPTLQAISKK